MPSPDSTSNANDENAPLLSATATTSAPPVQTEEQLDHLAQLVAAGELPFPTGLAAELVVRLAVEVRERRRRRLVQFIARSIAESIFVGVDREEGEEIQDVEFTI